jgi:hypothetical protein
MACVARSRYSTGTIAIISIIDDRELTLLHLQDIINNINRKMNISHCPMEATAKAKIPTTTTATAIIAKKPTVYPKGKRSNDDRRRERSDHDNDNDNDDNASFSKLFLQTLLPSCYRLSMCKMQDNNSFSDDDFNMNEQQQPVDVVSWDF